MNCPPAVFLVMVPGSAYKLVSHTLTFLILFILSFFLFYFFKKKFNRLNYNFNFKCDQCYAGMCVNMTSQTCFALVGVKYPPPPDFAKNDFFLKNHFIVLNRANIY